MFLPMFLICAAVVIIFAVLAIKLKKVRGLFVVMTVLALLPAAVLGLIAFGQGNLINYPGQPEEAVVGLVEELEAMNYEAADEYVLGSLGFVDADEDGYLLHLQLLMNECYGVRVEAEPIYEAFTAVLPVELSRLDTDAWLLALAEETEHALNDMVQSSARDKVFNADRTAYLDGITEQAYDRASTEMWSKGAEYTVTDTVNVTLSWTPFGWQIVLDEALISALEGFDVGDEEEITLNGNIAQRLGARLNTERQRFWKICLSLRKYLPLHRMHWWLLSQTLTASVPPMTPMKCCRSSKKPRI